MAAPVERGGNLNYPPIPTYSEATLLEAQGIMQRAQAQRLLLDAALPLPMLPQPALDIITNTEEMIFAKRLFQTEENPEHDNLGKLIPAMYGQQITECGDTITTYYKCNDNALASKLTINLKTFASKRIAIFAQLGNATDDDQRNQIIASAQRKLQHQQVRMFL